MWAKQLISIESYAKECWELVLVYALMNAMVNTSLIQILVLFYFELQYNIISAKVE